MGTTKNKWKYSNSWVCLNGLRAPCLKKEAMYDVTCVHNELDHFAHFNFSRASSWFKNESGTYHFPYTGHVGTVLWVEPGLPIPGVSPEEQLCEEACLQDGELVESILQCEGSHWWHQKLFKGRENDAYPRSQSQTIRHGRTLVPPQFPEQYATFIICI